MAEKRKKKCRFFFFFFEQEPAKELQFFVMVFGMPCTSSITHHYPAALALLAALSASLSFPESLMPAEPVQRMGHEEGQAAVEVGGAHSADVKCKVRLHAPCKIFHSLNPVD